MLALRGKHGAAQAGGDGEAGIYPAEEQPGKLRSRSMAAAVVAAAVGLLVPLQMVSQTWDDHDRSVDTPPATSATTTSTVLTKTP